MLRFLAGVCFGAALVWYWTITVFLPPKEYVADCDHAFDALYESERIIAKVLSDYDADMNAERKNNELCAVRGRLPKGLSTSTFYAPNIVLDEEFRFLMQTHPGAAYLPL